MDSYRELRDKAGSDLGNYYDFKFKGYIEALKEDWTVIDDMRLSDKDLNSPKSMNTHLHILEPYSNLYKVWPDQSLKKSIEGIF